VLLTVACAWACARAAVPPERDSTQTLTYDARRRSYLLHVPPSYDGHRRLPVVLAFHGGGGSAENQARVSGFGDLADEQGFLVVYPNGTGRWFERAFTWNGGGCCGYAQQQNVDDVGFVRALIGQLELEFSIDPHRIFATGLSNGGIMAYRLACEAADLIAAIAPVAGTQMAADCRPTEPVSVIHVHGTEDQHVPYDGGVGDDSLTRSNFASVPDTIAFWILQDHCPSRSDPTQDADVVHLAYAPCAGGTAVELYKIVGGGHAWPGSSGPAWPGGDAPTESISATELIWEFFASHPKP